MFSRTTTLIGFVTTWRQVNVEKTVTLATCYFGLSWFVWHYDGPQQLLKYMGKTELKHKCISHGISPFIDRIFVVLKLLDSSIQTFLPLWSLIITFLNDIEYQKSEVKYFFMFTLITNNFQCFCFPFDWFCQCKPGRKLYNQWAKSVKQTGRNSCLFSMDHFYPNILDALNFV